MKRKNTGLTWLASLALVLGLGSATADTPGITNTWLEISVSKAKCVQKAAVAIKSAGFSSNFEIIKESVYGDQEDYVALIRCVADHSLAYIVVTGPDSDVAGSYIDEVRAAFENELAKK